jgi:hypothetical protein
MATPARNEPTEADIIRRFARVAEIKKRALDPAPIPDERREPPPRKRKPRVLFVFPAKYARIMRACRVR